MTHVVLLGDSIFDNALYVPGGEPVIEQVRSRLPRGDRATLLAVDGAVIQSVARQLEKLPTDATHLVLSVGGNDALGYSTILDAQSLSAVEGFAALAEIRAEFAQAYRGMLKGVRELRLPTVICTIYDAVPGLQAEAVTALAVFNDAILRAGVEAGTPVIDLRFVCDRQQDYSSLSPIEPSELGGAKIAAAIARVVSGHDFARGGTVIYP